MVRRRPDNRFQEILEAAAAVFIEHGYRRTQMADVAAALGVAKGTLYLYFESKEALFDAALRYVDAGGERSAPASLPVRTPTPAETLAYVRAELTRQSELPSLLSALATPTVEDIEAELSGILFEVYDTLKRNRRRLKLLDRSARDYPEIAALWFDGARGGLLSILDAYLDERMSRGLLVREGDTGVTTRLLLETLVFWAVHRHWDQPPQTSDPIEVGEDIARSTVVRFLVRSLVVPKRPVAATRTRKEKKP